MADYDAQADRTPPPQAELSQVQIDADGVDLHAGLRGVATIVADARPVGEILRDVAEFAVRSIPGADGSGVTLVRSCNHRPQVQT
ncbi:MAG: hypothetical protein ACM4D3_24915, partial [Candidatus Sericytochromatia bacterium]